MNTKTLFVAIVTSTALAFGAPAIAATPAHDGADMQTGMHNGMQGDGKSMPMGGMMGMMKNCPMMAQLPPGNEKLSMQMHAEMMKAMGDILSKYADQVKVPEGK
ncbi:hypothetical protein [Bordetella muralis]|uniref:hypothetical protein n=1 Tax=Bordetella muralis TaxID=1649130 RepID=UPI0039EE3C5C